MSKDKMPDVIWARYLTTGTHGIVCEKAGMYHGKNGLNAKKTQYIRADILEQCVEALRQIRSGNHPSFNINRIADEALTAYEKMEK